MCVKNVTYLLINQVVNACFNLDPDPIVVVPTGSLDSSPFPGDFLLNFVCLVEQLLIQVPANTQNIITNFPTRSRIKHV